MPDFVFLPANIMRQGRDLQDKPAVAHRRKNGAVGRLFLIAALHLQLRFGGRAVIQRPGDDRGVQIGVREMQYQNLLA